MSNQLSIIFILRLINFCSLFPSSILLRLIEEVKKGGTHYTIFALGHRCAKIVSEPKGANPLWTPPIGWVGFLA